MADIFYFFLRWGLCPRAPVAAGTGGTGCLGAQGYTDPYGYIRDVAKDTQDISENNCFRGMDYPTQA